jgi:hypothetical protein
MLAATKWSRQPTRAHFLDHPAVRALALVAVEQRRVHGDVPAADRRDGTRIGEQVLRPRAVVLLAEVGPDDDQVVAVTSVAAASSAADRTLRPVVVSRNTGAPSGPRTVYRPRERWSTRRSAGASLRIKYDPGRVQVSATIGRRSGELAEPHLTSGTVTGSFEQR